MNRTWELNEKRRLWKRGLCRWCLGPVSPPRKTYCADECVHEWKLRSSQGYVRALVKKRDGGICSACRRDCLTLERDLTVVSCRSAAEFVERVSALGLDRRVPRWPLWTSLAVVEKADGTFSKPLYYTGEPTFRSLWEADHLVALEEGGTSDLSNLATLCWLCHKQKTAEHARRRAGRKRAASVAS